MSTDKKGIDTVPVGSFDVLYMFLVLSCKNLPILTWSANSEK